MNFLLHPSVVIRTMVGCAVLAAGVIMALLLGGCGPGGGPPPVPTVEWNEKKDGAAPGRRPLSLVDITTDKGTVVAREKTPAAVAGNPPLTCTAHLRIGGMDCGDCQHLIADELGRLDGVRQARVSQSPPETLVEYDPRKVTDKQIEATISNLGLWPKPVP